MRSPALAAILTALLFSPASAQLGMGSSDHILDRLSLEVFGGHVPAATDWMWVDMEWEFTTEATRHRLETLHGGTPLTGIGARYELTPGIRITGVVAYAPRDDRSLNLHSSSRVRFRTPERDHLHWQTSGGGTALGRIGLEAAPVRTAMLAMWLGGGAGLVRATSGLEEEVASQPHDIPSQFLDTWTAPTAFLTGRMEAPLIGSLGLALAADHHWTWWGSDDLEGGVEEFFESFDQFTGVTSDGMVAKMWLLRLGLMYHPN